MVNKIDERVNGKFLDLDHVHEELNEIFLRHQDALIAFRLSKARKLLDDFEGRLQLHMRHEEEWLLPFYEARRRRHEGLQSRSLEKSELGYLRANPQQVAS